MISFLWFLQLAKLFLHAHNLQNFQCIVISAGILIVRCSPPF